MSSMALVDLFRRELELCKVKEGEVMAVLSGPNTRPDYVDAFVAAGQLLRAEVFHLNLPAPMMPSVPGRIVTLRGLALLFFGARRIWRATSRRSPTRRCSRSTPR